MKDQIINEMQRQLAAHKCRQLFRNTRSTLAIRKVPVEYGDDGAAAWMREAAKIIDEQIGQRVREAATA